MLACVVPPGAGGIAFTAAATLFCRPRSLPLTKGIAVHAPNFVPSQKSSHALLHALWAGGSFTARWLKRTVLALVVLLVLLILAGFFLVPPLAKRQIEAFGPAEIERPVSVASIEFNPFKLEARVRGLVIEDKFGPQPLLTIDEVFIDLSAKSIVHFAPVVKRLQVTRPVVSVVRLDPTRYNFTDIVEKQLAKPRPPDEPATRFALFNLEILDGRVDFDDRPEKVKHAATDIHIGVPFLSSLPADVDVTVQPVLEARVNGDPLRITGQTTPFKDTVQTTLDLDYTDIDIARYLPYSPVDLRFRVPSGRLDTKLHALLVTKGGKPEALTITGTAGMRDLAVQHADGTRAIVVKAITGEIDRVEALARQVALKSVRIESPEVNVVRRSDGAISVMDLIPSSPPRKAAAPAATPAKPVTFSIGEIVVTGGRAEFEDHGAQPAFKTVLAPIDATVKKLSNARGSQAEVVMTLATDLGAKVEHRGLVALEPLSARGHVVITDMSIAKLQPYYAPYLNLKVAEGSADLASDYTTGEPGGDIAPRLENLEIALTQLRLTMPGLNTPVWRMPRLTMRGASVDVAHRQIELGDVTTTGAVAYVLRTADGNTYFDRIIKRVPPTHSAVATTAAEPPWVVHARRIAGSNTAVTVEDRVPSPPVVTRITALDVSLQDASNVKGHTSAVSLRGTVNGRGTFNVTGPMSGIPPKGRLSVRTRNVALAPFQPYAGDKVNLALNAGSISNAGTVIFDATPGRPLALVYQGDVTVADLAAVTKPEHQDLLRWKSMRVAGLNFVLQPRKADIESIALDDFYARVILNADGVFNLQQLTGAQPPEVSPAAAGTATPAPAGSAGRRSIETAAQAAAAKALPPANLRLGKITFTNGNVNFSDFYIKPNYTANLTGFTGTVTEMTPDKPGDVAIRAKIDDAAPVQIDGQVNALSPDLFLDVSASAKDIDLPPLSPYSAKYAGYGIQKGKLSVNVKYHIENRTLAAQNNVFLDQLTFGERVESPSATKLPVLLAVALLKDRNGVIDINLPISGSLDDPHFSVGGLIVRVIVNLITKAITAPFALIGAAFGGGPELSFIEFDAGSAVLNDGALKRLDALAKALDSRPGLKLEASGRVDPEPDREALKSMALQRKVKAQKVRQLTREGVDTPSPEGVVVAPAEYEQFLKRAYRAEDFDKPKNMLGFAKDIPVPEMERLMLANIQVSDEDLRVLANQRAQAAKSFLVDKGQVAGERIFLVSPVLTAQGVKEGKPARVDFSLK